ncbi:GGDEF domain-containing protein [Spirilliplanes yamanashiensis]|uniref:Diguanylate cyclase n=1 Tax=Spirilliplanes yamanashiensis TaxID=42233 RepID=A0A8J4DLX3_9ACTN|nr:GGDEF domain-containing protein [Spirilliplanes yamanashiensis]MDP9819096.1 diguanylate cyclase (GGDEF)-like protein [Spirilliplanes yamanashiensis]GIJ05550.1 diguanylate cyclase [Spirilliplanes yamanashiensis]
MDEVSRRAARMLSAAQTGGAARMLPLAESILEERTGALADGPAAMHFVRAVALIMLGDLRAAIAAAGLMLAAAEREGSAGWRSCALATRASERIKLGERDVSGHDGEAALRDLVAAEAALTDDEPDAVAAVNARVGIAVGYNQLRLYELVGPQFEEAYRISAADPELSAGKAMWLGNLADLHLRWALELYQIGEVARAERHTAQAEVWALQAATEACGPDAGTWRDAALLQAACARADRTDPAGAAADIERLTAVQEARGLGRTLLAYSLPFRAVALRRAGRVDEAVAIMERAVAELPPDAEWITVAATHRTHAVLLAAHGSAAARAALRYGDTLAGALWRQRQRTLHTAEALTSYETLRTEHEQAARAAETDALTGVANRRGFDRAVAALSAGPGRVTVLLIDLDRFKAVNDTRGHAAGDAALAAVAAAVSAGVRDGDVVARIGGDEFGALLPGADPVAGAGIAARIVRAVRDVPDCDATVSIGVAGGPAADLERTLRRADAAMYRAKRAGGDAVHDSDRPAARR